MLFVIECEVMKLAEAIDLVYLEIALFLVDDTHGCSYPSDWPLKKSSAHVCRAVGVMDTAAK